MFAVAAHAAPVRDAATAPLGVQRASSVQAAKGLERGLLQELNVLRSRAGLRPLRLSRGLAAAADSHSKSMAKYGYFSHSSEDGSRFWERIGKFYLKRPGWSLYVVGENLISGATDMTADEIIDGWLTSPPHRENLLARTWTEVGFGAVLASSAPGVYRGQDVAIITADFGVRR